MKLTFLGTSGSMPTERRGSPSLVIRVDRELLMFDCGEGTQRQMVKAHMGFQRPMKIFISHLHGDHVLGLPGLIQSMSLLHREEILHIYGPEGLVEYIKAFSDMLGGPSFPVIIYEIKQPGIIFESEKYKVKAVKAIHRITAWSYGFYEQPKPGKFYPEKAIQLGVPKGALWGKLQRGEPVTIGERVIYPGEVTGPKRLGRSIIYSGDTAPNRGIVDLAQGATVLIHEATFMEALSERAKQDGHTTARQAAQIAKEAGVKQLILTHISSRYPDPDELRSEAAEVFENVIVAEDLMELDLPLE